MGCVLFGAALVKLKILCSTADAATSHPEFALEPGWHGPILHYDFADSPPGKSP